MDKYYYKNLERASSLLREASETLFESQQFPNSAFSPNKLLYKQAELTIETALALIAQKDTSKD